MCNIYSSSVPDWWQLASIKVLADSRKSGQLRMSLHAVSYQMCLAGNAIVMSSLVLDQLNQTLGSNDNYM